MANSKKKGAPKNSNNILIGVGALVVVLLLFAFLKPDSSELVPGGQDDARSKEMADAPNTATNFDYMLRGEWDGLERAERNIQSLGEGQVIVPGIVQDPTNNDVVYFSSTSFNEEKTETFVSVYKYNTDDYQFERLYKGTFGLDNQFRGEWLHDGEPWAPTFGAFAYDSGKLILAVVPHTRTDDCGGYLIPGPGPDYIVMDLEDPYSGFNHKITSTSGASLEQIDKDTARYRDCAN